LLTIVFNGCDSRSSQTGTTEPPSAEAIRTSLDAADRYFTSQDYSNAELILRKLVERAPSNVEAREFYGLVLATQAVRARDRGEVAPAHELFQRAYEEYAASITPSANAGLHHSAGMIALQAERPDDALGHFSEAMRTDPANPQYPLHAAQLLMLRGQLDDASTLLNRVIELDASEPMAYASLAGVALERGELDRATQLIEQARSIDADDIAIRVQHSKILRRVDRPTQSLELMVPLDDATRATEAVAFEIASSYGMLGEHRKAAEAWEHCYRTWSSTAPALAWPAAVRAADAMLNAGDRERAYLWWQEARLLAPASPEVADLERRLAESAAAAAK
jgi:tetratricopeptide (TPR) repeat protein